VLDLIIMQNNIDIMQSQYMQFGFKSGHSTTQCTFVMDEIIDYYTRHGSSVYLIMLDASRAFERVQYIKLFTLLISRGMCPMYSRLLVNMYTNQCLRVKWNSIFTNKFVICNGVKQGGVLSPLLFCIYIDELFVRLKKSRVGCYIGNIYAGAVGYADDVSLIAPSYCAAKHMLRICEEYAREFDVVFNSSKSVLVVYNGDHNVRLTLNDVALARYDNAMHLGHNVGVDSNKLNIKKACINLYNSVNVMLSRFGSCYASTKFNLFCTYCTSFYGCPMWNLESKDVNKFYVAWRKCIRNVWSIPSRTHCNLLHHICLVDSITIIISICLVLPKDTC
jgi:hypothetical protein